jgi:hypothetical protein
MHGSVLEEVMLQGDWWVPRTPKEISLLLQTCLEKVFFRSGRATIRAVLVLRAVGIGLF